MVALLQRMAADVAPAGGSVKALSLWQPHATAIGLKLKPWETRHWSTAYRGPIAIHAALRRWTDADAWSLAARRRLDVHAHKHGPVPMVYGAVVCTATLADCVRTSLLRGRIPPDDEFWGDFSDGDDGMGRYAFALRDVVMLAEPLIARGFQGFFNVELGVLERHSSSATTLPLFGE